MRRSNRSHRIVDWNAEDTAAWEGGNKKVARRNLLCTVAGDHVAFSIWSLWPVMALFMPASVYGFSVGDKLLLGAVATLDRWLRAHPLHVGHRRLRGSQLDNVLGVRAADPYRRDHRAAGQPGTTPVAVCGVRRAHRAGRWQLRRIADQRQRLLPAAPQGRGAGDQRRRRQPRGRGDPIGRAAGAGDWRVTKRRTGSARSTWCCWWSSVSRRPCSWTTSTTASR